MTLRWRGGSRSSGLPSYGLQPEANTLTNRPFSSKVYESVHFLSKLTAVRAVIFICTNAT
jgi:hypothetical protein